MAQSPLSSSIENISTSGRWADDVDSASTSDDEIVWSLSSSPELDSQGAGRRSPLSDDFILISRTGSPGGIASVLSSPRSGPSTDSPELIAALSSMSLSPAASSNFSSFVVNMPKGKTPVTLPATPAKPKQQQQPPTPTSPATLSKQARKTKAKAKAKAKAKKAQEGPSQPQPATPKKKAPNAKSASASYPSPPSSPAENRSGSKKAKNAAKSQSQNPPAAYARSVVDDASSVGGDEASSADSDDEQPSPAYVEARKFMTSYLANPPPAGNNGSTLLLMQALIIELGIDTTRRSSTSKKPTPSPFSIPNLPNTMTQAKLLLKGSAFINIRDYLDVREQGQGALRRAMHPSRSALAKDVRKKRMPLGWVKKTGLNVLLVNTRFN